MKIFLYAILFTLILYPIALADDKSDAYELLKSKLDKVIEVLQNKSLEQKAKREKVVEIVLPMFAFPLMAKLSLGKTHWSGLTNEKREKFIDIFTKLLKQSYSAKLVIYDDEAVVYKEPVLVKKKIHILIELVSQDKKITMLYKLYKSKSGWLVYDLEVEGVSVIQTYRSQFDAAFQKGTIDDLLLKLEEKIKTLSLKDESK